MNWIIDYLLKRGWLLAAIGLLLAVIALMYIALQRKDVVIAGLKAQNVAQYIALQQAQAVAAEEKRLNDINAKKAQEYRVLADSQLSEIQRMQVPEECEKAKEWLIRNISP